MPFYIKGVLNTNDTDRVAKKYSRLYTNVFITWAKENRLWVQSLKLLVVDS
jgi:hypothetical protein